MCLNKLYEIPLTKGHIGYTILRYKILQSKQVGRPIFKSLFMDNQVKIDQWEIEGCQSHITNTGGSVYYKTGYHHFIHLDQALEYWRIIRDLFDSRTQITILCPVVIKDIGATGVVDGTGLFCMFNGVRHRYEMIVARKRFILPIRYLPGPRGLYTFVHLNPEDLKPED